jgi:hypothetical protein
MKATPVLKVFVVSLVLVLIAGPATVAAAESGKAAIISGYKAGSGYAQIGITKPDKNLFTDPIVKPNPKPEGVKSDLPYQFDLNSWQKFPGSTEYCSTCAVKNATKSWYSMSVGQYSSPFAGFWFGGAGSGAGAAPGGGCCG